MLCLIDNRTHITLPQKTAMSSYHPPSRLEEARQPLLGRRGHPRQGRRARPKLSVIQEQQRRTRERRDSLVDRSVTYSDLSDIRRLDTTPANERTPLVQVARQLRQGLDEILGVPVDRFKGHTKHFDSILSGHFMPLPNSLGRAGDFKYFASLT